MARRKINRLLMQWFGDRFVEEVTDEKMAAVGRRDPLLAIRWQHPNYAGQNTRLSTPYGLLEVCRFIRPSWFVQRDSVVLIHARSSDPALFTSLAAAKAAGLVHLTDGFCNKMPCQDGLWWDIKRPTVAHWAIPNAFDNPADQPDDHEWGRRSLDRLLEQSSTPACAADENLIIDLEGAARCWQLLPPTWSKRAPGCFELDTPYGTLIVRRLIGWTVERDGDPLVWFGRRHRVIFDKLEHARMSALLHAVDYGESRFGDGTLWDERANDRGGMPDYSASQGGGDSVVVS